ncbi:MAG: C10 family peptidase, partial [Candidatus Kapaibacterium sp.]
NKSSLMNTVRMELVDELKTTVPKLGNETLYFVFANLNGKGFVIVSGDDAVEPILGYSTENNYTITNQPPSFLYWMKGLTNQIESIKLRNIKASNETIIKWNNLVNADEKSLSKLQGTSGVDNLCKAKWNQSGVFFNMCPYDSTENKRSVSGCVATAMAIIMKYHSFPKQGTGFSSYNHKKYGTLSANYGATTYDWEAMSDTISERSPADASPAISTLLSQCGISINMGYSPSSSGAVSAGFYTSGRVARDSSDTSAFVSFFRYFGYSDSMNALQRTRFTDAEWDSIIKREIDAKRPLFYAGSGPGGGHAFVCDGYDDNGRFSFNWGWGGNSDGFYLTKALEPKDLGTGAGNGTYNSNQRIFTGIEPKRALVNSSLKASIFLNSKIALTKDTIEVGAPFDVTFTLKNTGKVDYNGNCYLGMFNEDDKLVSKIGDEQSISLAQGMEKVLTFSTTGIKNAIPGRYKIHAYYKFGNGWQFVEYGSQYLNKGILNVISNNTSLELASNIISSLKTIEPSKPFKLNLSVMNKGTTTFKGDLSIDLHESGGEWVKSLDSFNFGPNGLSASTKTNLLNFDIPALEVEPGSYDIIVWFKPDNSKSEADWEWVGSTSSYQNPLEVIVSAPELIPDQYEDNNTDGKAFKLPVNFTGNSASIKTLNSNIHNVSDEDYYEINLPSGSNYEITARIHDLENTGDGMKYSADAIFSYATGNFKSDVYEDVMPNIIKSNGGVYKFLVSPAFAGFTGTYSLDLNITKVVSSVNDENKTELKFSPNPVKNNLNIDLGSEFSKVKNITISDIKGTELKVINLKSNQNENYDLNVTELQSGSYLVTVNFESFKKDFIFKIIK